MIQVEVHRVTGATLEECLEKLAGRRKVKPLEEEMLGLDIRPNKTPGGKYKWEPSTLGGRPADEATLLTLRRDLTSLREKVLKGAGRRATLRELDYTIDQLDNVLGEM